MSGKRPPTSAENIRAAFAVFDTDGSGTLTVDELVGIMTDPATGSPMGIAEATVFVAKFDRNSDGQLDLDEFAASMTPRAGVRASGAKAKQEALQRGAPGGLDRSGSSDCPKGGPHAFAFGKCTKVSPSPPPCALEPGCVHASHTAWAALTAARVPPPQCDRREDWVRGNPSTARARSIR